MRRAQVLALLLAPLLVGADLPAPEKADWSKVPPDVQKLIHTSVVRLPDYPEREARLIDVRLWPATREFDGVTYTLKIDTTIVAQVQAGGCDSMVVADSRPGFASYYVGHPTNGKHEEMRGPFYSWRGDSTIFERAYLTPGEHRSWFYDLQERVYLYMLTRPGSVVKTGRVSIEYYGVDGWLVGCELAGLGKFYWMAKELPKPEFRRLLGLFYESVRCRK